MSRGTVLVVEDEPDVMLTFRIVLRTAGFEVVGVATGEAALAILETEVPAAMIVDLLLPGIDGWELLATIRERDLLPITPIVVVSAHAHPDQRARAAGLGCTALFTKPFSAEQLRTTLERATTDSAPPPGP